MKFFEYAAPKQRKRGIKYYREGKVRSVEKTSQSVVRGTIRGKDAHYRVRLDLLIPAQSTCSCPYVKKNGDMCKHMVALYFAAFPEELLQKEQTEQPGKDRLREEKIRKRTEAEELVTARVDEMNDLQLKVALRDVVLRGGKQAINLFLKNYVHQTPPFFEMLTYEGVIQEALEYNAPQEQGVARYGRKLSDQIVEPTDFLPSSLIPRLPPNNTKQDYFQAIQRKFCLVYDGAGKVLTDLVLLEKVRKLRVELMCQECCPAYFIIKNKGLVTLATYKPTDRESFVALPGMGERLYEKYGVSFVSVIRAHLDD